MMLYTPLGRYACEFPTRFTAGLHEVRWNRHGSHPDYEDDDEHYGKETRRGAPKTNVACLVVKWRIRPTFHVVCIHYFF